MSKYIKWFALALLLFCVFHRPQEASAKYFSAVNADIVSCPAFGDVASYVGNNAYIHIQWRRSNYLQEYLLVYDYPPPRIELWWNGANYDSIKVHAIDGGGSEYDVWCSYSRITYDGQEKGSFSSFGGDSVAYWLNEKYTDIQIKYCKIDVLKVLYETFDSSVLIPTPTLTPSPTPTPTPTPIPVTNIEIEDTGITKLFDGALRLFNIPIQIVGIEITWWQIFVYLILAFLVIDLIFSPSDK